MPERWCPCWIWSWRGNDRASHLGPLLGSANCCSIALQIGGVTPYGLPEGLPIWIDSRLGEGTTVELRLPLVTPPEPIADRDPASTTAGAGRSALVSTAFVLPDPPEEVMT